MLPFFEPSTSIIAHMDTSIPDVDPGDRLRGRELPTSSINEKDLFNLKPPIPTNNYGIIVKIPSYSRNLE